MITSPLKFDADHLFDSAAAQITLLPQRGRFSLRVADADRAALGTAIGMDLPDTIGTSTFVRDVFIACLGPDEWMIRMPVEATGDFMARCDEAYATLPHSLVDLSDREVSFEVKGAKVLDLLSIGCPRDLRHFAIGEARRTLFDGASVILWRPSEGTFLLDVWRSFAPHVYDTLTTGCRELSSN